MAGGHVVPPGHLTRAAMRPVLRGRDLQLHSLQLDLRWRLPQLHEWETIGEPAQRCQQQAREQQSDQRLGPAQWQPLRANPQRRVDQQVALEVEAEEADNGERGQQPRGAFGNHAQQAEERDQEDADPDQLRDVFEGRRETVDDEGLLDGQQPVPDDDVLREEQVAPEDREAEAELA